MSTLLLSVFTCLSKLSGEAWLRIGLVAAGLAGGLIAGKLIYQPKAIVPVVQSYSPAQRQPDGSLVLEKKPMSALKPVSQVPQGYSLIRQSQVTVKPNASSTTGSSTTSAWPWPLTLDLSLVTGNAGTPNAGQTNLIASSPDGTVIGGFDMPLVETKAFAVPRWGAGLVASSQGRIGAYVQKDLSTRILGLPVSVGGSVTTCRSSALGGTIGQVEVSVMAGVRW